MCNHRSCADIKKHNITAAGCVLFKTVNNKRIVFLGLEKKGPRVNQYNICVGKMDYEDDGCYLKTLSRELLEEFGLRTSFELNIINGITEPSTFDIIFKLPYGKLIYTIFHNVVIFLGVLPAETSRSMFNNAINDNRVLGPTYNEMEYIHSFYSDNLLPLDNIFPRYPITQIAATSINEFKNWKLL